MSYRLSDARFKEGIDSYLGVLISQQSLYNAQRALVGTRLAKRANQVELFKVLGGGI
jgi:multidrug efflux system outer membrane protein